MSQRFLNNRASALLGLIAILAVSPGRAGMIVDQISDPFSPVTFGNPPGTFGFSQFDLGAVGPPADSTDPNFRPDFSTAFDNFTPSMDTAISGFSWVGAYEVIGGPTAPSFTVSLFGNDTGGPFDDQPGSLLFSTNVGSALESSIGGGFFSYSASVSPFAISAGETYWFSVVANLDFDDNGWGLAFSDIGDGISILDFAELESEALMRFEDPIDYAFSVQAVPEPSSFVTIATLVCATVGVRRRRRSPSER